MLKLKRTWQNMERERNASRPEFSFSRTDRDDTRPWSGHLGIFAYVLLAAVLLGLGRPPTAQAQGATCTTADYQTFATLSLTYVDLATQQARLADEILVLTQELPSALAAKNPALIKDNLALLADLAENLESDALMAVSAVQSLTPSDSTLKTAQAQATKAYGNTEEIAASLSDALAALAANDRAALKVLLENAEELYASLIDLVPSYAALADSLATTPCLVAPK